MSNCHTFEYVRTKVPGSKTFTICGVSENDHIYNRILKTDSFYETDLLEYISNVVGDDAKKNVVIDIGANIGNHSVYLGKFVAGRLISVEANPNVLPILRSNLERNIDNYTIYECALGAAEGKGIVSMPEGSSNNIGMAMVEFIDDGALTDEAVPVRTLDQVIDEYKANNPGEFKISAIKIDVEGSEVSVLSGASETLSEYHPDLFIEAADKAFRKDIENIILPYGYKRISRWAATPVYHYVYQPALSVYLQAFVLKVKYKFKRRVARLKRKLKKIV
jgi:FkbM family methyltransferase